MRQMTIAAVITLSLLGAAPAAQADQYLDTYANERITEQQQSMPYFPPAGAYEAHGTGAPLQYEQQNRGTLCQTTEIGTHCSQ